MLNINIRTLRKKNKLSQEVLADELGVSTTQLSNYELGIREPNHQFLIRLSDRFQVSIDVLLRADLSKTDLNDLLNIGGNRILLPIQVGKDKEDNIEFVHAKASAGYLTGYGDPDFIGELPMINLPFLKNGKFRAFTIAGDSMYPHVKEKDIVVGKFIETIEEIKNDFTYIVLTNEGLVYKRLKNNIREDGTIIFNSDNPLYSPYKVSPENMLELWEYSCLIDTQEKRWRDSMLDTVALSLQSLQKDVAQIKAAVSRKS